ncbi:hypothetical protein T10_11317 [Trichinella papuae]|uniref:Uncharacterized protein n=1 Tax=Trichinella papuae TaxID=268474 RepID=A0A0V1MF14_9BILA|nr:hypothetical protein T10_11317 [Trichinella papuae]
MSTKCCPASSDECKRTRSKKRIKEKIRNRAERRRLRRFSDSSTASEIDHNTNLHNNSRPQVENEELEEELTVHNFELSPISARSDVSFSKPAYLIKNPLFNWFDDATLHFKFNCFNIVPSEMVNPFSNQQACSDLDNSNENYGKISETENSSPGIISVEMLDKLSNQFDNLIQIETENKSAQTDLTMLVLSPSRSERELAENFSHDTTDSRRLTLDDLHLLVEKRDKIENIFDVIEQFLDIFSGKCSLSTTTVRLIENLRRRLAADKLAIDGMLLHSFLYCGYHVSDLPLVDRKQFQMAVFFDKFNSLKREQFSDKIDATWTRIRNHHQRLLESRKAMIKHFACFI